MRTREDYFISKTYLKENATAEKPLYIWLSERLGKNLPIDEYQRPLLLKLLKTLIKDEQSALKGKKKKLPTSVTTPLNNKPISTANVDISPSSFPPNSSRVQSESKTLKNAYQNVYRPSKNILLKNLLEEADSLENQG
jgi:hypothetical protein